MDDQETIDSRPYGVHVGGIGGIRSDDFPTWLEAGVVVVLTCTDGVVTAEVRRVVAEL